MNSLESLNNAASALIEYTDNRSARAVLDRIVVGNVSQTITDLTFKPRTPVNITEIINYATAATQVEWVIQNISGSSILYPTLPAHLTLTQVGDTYTITGLQTEADWNLIKNFTWLLPANYASANGWFLETTISYFDEALGVRVDVNWDTYDPRYGYTLSANAAFTMSCTAGKIHSTANSTLDSEFGMLITQFAIDATTSMTVDFVKRPIDFADSYGFTGLQGNLIWATAPIQLLDDPNPTTGYSDDFKITVRAVDDAFTPNKTGYFTHPDAINPTEPDNAKILTGLTRSELNAAISNFTFWPYRTQTSNTMIHVEIEQLFTSQTFPDGQYFDVLNTHIDLIYQGAAALPATRYFTYNGDGAVPVTQTELLYSPFEFDMIGGGGSGAFQYRGGGAFSDAGGGGGAGAYTRPSSTYIGHNTTTAYSTMAVKVGIGGAAPTSDGQDGNNGTETTFGLGQISFPGSYTYITNSSDYYANGGLGGKSVSYPSPVNPAGGGDSGATLGTVPLKGYGGDGVISGGYGGGGGGGGWKEDTSGPPGPYNQDGEDAVPGTGTGHAAGGIGFTGVLLGDTIASTVAVGGFGGETGFGDSGSTSSTVNTGAGSGGNGAGGNSGQIPTAGRNGEIRIKIGT